MKNNIELQYQTAYNLKMRISIHDKYSTNPEPFGNWIMSHYQIGENFRILELGCGTGDMWRGKMDILPAGAHLILTDFSPGMLETAKSNTSCDARIDYHVVNIEEIPYEDASFDMVIANMMLYHVPDLHRGLSEVRRVLKPDCKFYCATYGEHGIMEFINNCLREQHIHGEIGKSFTLQNGAKALKAHFSDVRMEIREDGLAVTDIDDFVDYTLSLSNLTGISGTSREAIRDAYAKRVKNGILYVPKEYGMFISK